MITARGIVAAFLFLGVESTSPAQRPMCQMGCMRRGVKHQAACLNKCDSYYSPTTSKAYAGSSRRQAPGSLPEQMRLLLQSDDFEGLCGLVAGVSAVTFAGQHSAWNKGAAHKGRPIGNPSWLPRAPDGRHQQFEALVEEPRQNLAAASSARSEGQADAPLADRGGAAERAVSCLPTTVGPHGGDQSSFWPSA